jgi:sporulation integral membrane protein YtvI
MNPVLIKQILRGAWIAVILTLVALGLYFIIPLVYPFIIGWMIAYMLNPLVRLLQRRAKFPRWLAVMVSLLIFLGLAITLISFLVANIIVEVGTLAETLQDQINGWKDQFIAFLNSNDFQQLVDQLNRFYEQNPNYQNTINSNLSTTAKTIADFSSLVISFFFNSVVALVSALPKIATMALISLLASFFIGKDWFRLSRQIADWFSPSVLNATRSIWADLQKALFGYLRAQLIMVSMTAVIVMTGLILLHVEYAVAIGLLVGVADLIPYVGTGVIMIPWIIYSLLQGDIYLAVGLSINYGVGIAARQLLEPKVLASNVGLDPLPLLIAMFVGLRLFGAVGLIIGPVSLVLLYAFHRANVFRDIRTYIVEGRMKPVE